MPLWEIFERFLQCPLPWNGEVNHEAFYTALRGFQGPRPEGNLRTRHRHVCQSPFVGRGFGAATLHSELHSPLEVLGYLHRVPLETLCLVGGGNHLDSRRHGDRLRDGIAEESCSIAFNQRNPRCQVAPTSEGEFTDLVPGREVSQELVGCRPAGLQVLSTLDEALNMGRIELQRDLFPVLLHLQELVEGALVGSGQECCRMRCVLEGGGSIRVSRQEVLGVQCREPPVGYFGSEAPGRCEGEFVPGSDGGQRVGSAGESVDCLVGVTDKDLLEVGLALEEARHRGAEVLGLIDE